MPRAQDDDGNRDYSRGSKNCKRRRSRSQDDLHHRSSRDRIDERDRYSSDKNSTHVRQCDASISSNDRPRRAAGASFDRLHMPNAPPHAPRARRWFASTYDPIQIGSIDGTDTTPHDKALTRALHARFDATKDPKIRGDPYKTLFVGRLAFTTTDDALRTFLQHFGAIASIRLVRDVATQQSRGYAFVEFERTRDFERAYHGANGLELDGRVLLVDYERSRVMPGWKPRRLGGGLGGRKESGQLRFGGRDHPFKPPARLQHSA